MKLLGLDIGDRWVGTALSDEIGITTRPYQTVENKNLLTFITHLITIEPITAIIVGYPKTMKGSESEQTKKIVLHVEELRKKIPSIPWILWDERLSSKQAAHLKHAKTKEDKINSHSIAAALILKSYLDHLEFQKFLQE